MKRALSTIVTGLVLPIGFGFPAFAQYSPLALPSWYDYGVMRQQTINGGDVERQVEEYEERQVEEYQPEQPAQEPAAATDYSTALQIYEQAVTEEGLPADDPATAIAFFVVANYMVATGQSGDISSEADQAILKQFRQALSQNEEFQSASAEERRSIANDMAVTGVEIYLGALSAEQDGNTQALENLRQTAQNNLESFMGVSVSRIRLTDDGVIVQ